MVKYKNSNTKEYKCTHMYDPNVEADDFILLVLEVNMGKRKYKIICVYLTTRSIKDQLILRE